MKNIISTACLFICLVYLNGCGNILHRREIAHIQVHTVTLGISEDAQNNYLLIKIISLIPKEKQPKVLTDNLMKGDYVLLAAQEDLSDVLGREDKNSLAFKYLDIYSKRDYTKKPMQESLRLIFYGPPDVTYDRSYQSSNWYYVKGIALFEGADKKIALNAADVSYWCEEVYSRLEPQR